jgi:hypothetical protein
MCVDGSHMQSSERTLALGVRVRVRKDNSCWDGKKGVIDAMFEHADGKKMYGVHFKNQQRVICFKENQLEVIYE